MIHHLCGVVHACDYFNRRDACLDHINIGELIVLFLFLVIGDFSGLDEHIVLHIPVILEVRLHFKVYARAFPFQGKPFLVR